MVRANGEHPATVLLPGEDVKSDSESPSSQVVGAHRAELDFLVAFSDYR